MERFEDAITSYAHATHLDKADNRVQYRLGVCLHQLERWAEASQAFQKALEQDPHHDEARLALGACLLHLNRREEALAHFDRCWSNAARPQALFGKAVVLQQLGRLREAETAYQRVLALDPKTEETLANLIALYMEAHDLENARRYSMQLLESSPESLTALQALAAVALENRQYDSAVRYCSRIVEQSPDCVEAWHNLRFASGRMMSTLRASAAAAGSTSGRK